MEQFKNPIIDATGGIHIGETFMRSFQASWPFGKIEIYEDYIILKIQHVPAFLIKLFELHAKVTNKLFLPSWGSSQKIPKEINLSYSDIQGFKEKDAWIMGYGITIIHTNNKYPLFLQVWISKNKAKIIIRYFNNRGIYKQE
jgi:hypothetical protein